MSILHFGNCIRRYRLAGSVAVLFAATLAIAVSVCAVTPVTAQAQGMTGSNHHAPMSGNCYTNCGISAHAIATSPNNPTSQSSQRGGHVAIAATADTVVLPAQSKRLLHPPIRAPAAPSRPLYLLDCALLN